MTLNPETEGLLREFFAAHTCWKCSGAAVRLCQGRFYCVEHVPSTTPRRSAAPKVFHYPLGLRG